MPSCRYCALLSALSMTMIRRVLIFFAASTSWRISTRIAVEKMRTLARKLSSATIMRSVFSHCATMRKSSSTASTLAAPARNMAWLSARMILSIGYAAIRRRPRSSFRPFAAGQNNRAGCFTRARKSLLRSTHELVVVDHAGHAALITMRTLSAHDASLATHAHIVVASDDVGRKRNLEFNLRADLQLRVSVNVHAGSTHVLRGARGLIGGLSLPDGDRQIERKPSACSSVGQTASPYSRPRFQG